MGKNVLVSAEQRDGVLKKVAFEMLGTGAELAADIANTVMADLSMSMAKNAGIKSLGGAKINLCGHFKVYFLLACPFLMTFSDLIGQDS